jgi:hypothetical protein
MSGGWKVKGIGWRGDLSNEHWPEQIGPFRVVDVKFSRLSIFSRVGGRECGFLELCGFVMRDGWPLPHDVSHVVRYRLRNGSSVYRMYVYGEREREKWERESGGNDGS